MEPPSLYAPPFEAVSTLSVYPSIIHPAIDPSQVFEQELAGNAKALFPTLNIEGLIE